MKSYIKKSYNLDGLSNSQVKKGEDLRGRETGSDLSNGVSGLRVVSGTS